MVPVGQGPGGYEKARAVLAAFIVAETRPNRSSQDPDRCGFIHHLFFQPEVTDAMSQAKHSGEYECAWLRPLPLPRCLWVRHVYEIPLACSFLIFVMVTAIPGAEPRSRTMYPPGCAIRIQDSRPKGPAGIAGREEMSTRSPRCARSAAVVEPKFQEFANVSIPGNHPETDGGRPGNSSAGAITSPSAHRIGRSYRRYRGWCCSNGCMSCS